MGLVTAIGVLLIACISIGESFSLGPLCLHTPKPCSSASDCPKLLPVCDNGKCCFRATPKKRGSCPIIKPGTFGVCGGTFCTSDNNCKNGKICCPAACGGMMCTTPVDQTSPDTTSTTETCPRTPFGTNIICPAVLLPDQCNEDKDCPKGKKCCFVGCGPRKCHDAVVTPIDLDLFDIRLRK